jgi:hypothetical protein
MVLEMLLSDMPDKGYKWNDAGTQNAIASDVGTGNSTTGLAWR